MDGVHKLVMNALLHSTIFSRRKPPHLQPLLVAFEFTAQHHHPPDVLDLISTSLWAMTRASERLPMVLHCHFRSASAGLFFFKAIHVGLNSTTTPTKQMLAYK
ncbi:hypothetical protein K443DRAFT_354023 [Laccaria amethystina LaAM-08-1]|uniref:Unplaced genomic scaffold K443scaffold_25, whole genome shotgun sequence n=1 Tax=Laccaria amethystina LaAM-08-1 TaxID=1095629 RepID=A0A0C9Y5M7_9AGAR|nr:hypothetical protein K443DRAFT_354023 [Laccaria amethystina LaAM-08-1]